MIRLSSRSAGVTGNRADDFLLQLTSTKWLLRASAGAQSCELEGSVIIPQTMTVLRDRDSLWSTLQPGCSTVLVYPDRLLENIKAHFKPAQLFTLGTE